MRPTPHFRPRRGKGFTLVEVLLATTIMAGLVTMVLGITVNILNIWNRSQSTISASIQARIALSIFEEDIEAIELRGQGDERLRIETIPNVGPPSFTTTFPYFMFFVDSPSQYSTWDGGLSTVAYNLGYIDPFGTTDNEMFAMFRTMISPQSTFDSALGWSTADGGLRNFWNPDPDIPLPVNPNVNDPPDATSPVELQNLIALNVVRMQIAIGYTDINDQPQIAVIGDPSDSATLQLASEIQDEAGSSVRIAETLTYGETFELDGSPIPGADLEFIELSITFLSTEGVRQMRNAIAGRIPEPGSDIGMPALDALIMEYGTTFSRRVYVWSKKRN